MSEEDARLVAARAVGAVIGSGRSLDEALPAEASPRARALAFETLRFGLRYRFQLGRLMDRPLPRKEWAVQGLLLVSICELDRFRTPEYATVDAAVAATRALGRPRLAKLVNGVLRNWLRRRDELEEAAESDPEARAAHPRWLLDQFAADWPEAWPAIVAAGNDKGPMWLRVNARRTDPAAYRERLAQAGIEAVPGPVPEALRLDQPVEVAKLPGFAAGEVSVQDAAAQLAAGLLAPGDGDRVLDAACAPGGKTAHLLERYPNLGSLVGVDVEAGRLERTSENLARLGLTAELHTGDAATPDEWWDGAPFDRILLDAPCSGTGVIRRHPDIKWLRRASDTAAYAETQARLLHAAWRLLAPGGRLLYATCSVLRAENEAVVGPFVDNTPEARALDLPGDWGRPAGRGRQVLPGEEGTDGFFYALLARQD